MSDTFLTGNGPYSGPCSAWITHADVQACCSGLANPPDGAALDRAIAYATEILFNLSGRRFTGSCSRTVRPCFGDNAGCGNGFYAQWPMSGWSFWVWDQAAQGYSFPTTPYLIDGQWFNFGGCAGQCSLSTVLLPMPAQSVEQVVIDGLIIPPEEYQLTRYGYLELLTPNRNWPCTQNRSRKSESFIDDPGDDDRDQTWQVTYTYGRPLSPGGVIAASRFACEMAKAMCGASDCNLPARLKDIVREGVTMSFADPLEFIDKGEVGIYEVDLWLNSVNPAKLIRRSTVRRLDAPAQYRGVTSPPTVGP